MSKPKSISKAALDRMIKKADGDWDFLMFLLANYWVKL